MFEEKPSFLSRMEDERVVEGSNTVLECVSTGSPKPHISWSKDNVLIRGNVDELSRIRIKDGGSFLIVKDVRLEDAGRYECLLSNAVGVARDSLTLSVIPSKFSVQRFFEEINVFFYINKVTSLVVSCVR
jgi:hypothetical protein